MDQIEDRIFSGRREFLRHSGIGVPLTLAGGALPALGLMAMAPTAKAACPNPNPSRTLPTRVIGSAVLNVRDYGARGNGVHDDSVALQNAVNALPASGGTVQVPAGIYLINATRAAGNHEEERYGVRLRSNMRLDLMQGAELVAIPNSDDPNRATDRNYILYAYMASELEISGGKIVGERTRHEAIAGKKSEWGNGIQFRGVQRATIRDVEVSDCWGDCITLGRTSLVDGSMPSTDIVISNVVCSGARRQGLTIGTTRRVSVYDSEFNNIFGTGISGSGNGIVVEPDGTGAADVIHIENCIARNNFGAGIHVVTLVQDGATATITGVTIRQCRAEYNTHGIRVQGDRVSNGFIALNQIRSNGLRGLALIAGVSNYQVSGNYFSNNHTTAPATNTPAEITGWESRLWKHIQYTDDIDIQAAVGRNFYWTVS
ncbi:MULTISPECIES: right-handed parallel beta-helix repeat-containing protein [unclassified Pseudoxanthomonas]|uniref:glycosyl hydrolase family 28-related protein n=1 Tax=unclassified Pseudoxanthomonas TaxID=2645906 RepID=UPI0030770E7C